MSSRRKMGRETDFLRDAMALLSGWHISGGELYRTLPIDDAQHAALAERIQIFADTLQVRPRIRRGDGQTRIGLDASETGELSVMEVNLAARIEDAYRTIVGLA
jgi:4a-hydroxytetrahydrobiopterin dehydratase